jgi:flavin-binding protein dodecin
MSSVAVAATGVAASEGVAVSVIKSIDLVGVSSESWRDAANAALQEAAKTLRGIEGMEVMETSAIVEGDKVKEYHTHVRIRFRLER